MEGSISFLSAGEILHGNALPQLGAAEPEASQQLERRDSSSPVLLSQERQHANTPGLLGEEAGSCPGPGLTPLSCVFSHGRILLRREGCSVHALRHVVYWLSPAVRASGLGRPEEMDARGNYPSLVWVCQARNICAGRVVLGQVCSGLAAKPAVLLALGSPCPVPK